MAKYLKYDESTGIITDGKGTVLTTLHGYSGIDIKESKSVDEMIKLKNAGFTAQEIIEMRKAGL